MSSGFNAAFLRAWENRDNETIDDVIATLNEGVEDKSAQWTKKSAQKEAARYRKAGVELRKFTRPRIKEAVNVEAAKAFLEQLTAKHEDTGAKDALDKMGDE